MSSGMTKHNANVKYCNNKRPGQAYACRAVGMTTAVNATDCHNDGASMQAKAHGGAAVNIMQHSTHYDHKKSHTTTNLPPNEGSQEIPVLIKDTQ